MFRIEHAAFSDVGMRRSNNQDSYAAELAVGDGIACRGHLFLVADGMGAHAAGELASKLAADSIPLSYRKAKDLAPPAALRQAVRKANDLIHAKGEGNADFKGMGTTCSTLVLLSDAALVAHVGDSRVYRLRRGLLEQLTFDHSLVWEMAAASHTSEEKVPSCIPKNVITRSLGPHPTVNVDLEGPHPLEDGDTYLLCSDGLNGVVEDVLLGALIGAMPPSEAGQTLVDLANLRGGPDNITLQVVRLHEEEVDESTAQQSQEQGKKSRCMTQLTAWMVALASLLALVWFGSQQQATPTILASVALGASVVVALVKRAASRSKEEDVVHQLGGPYGNGPHRSHACTPNQKSVDAVQNVVQELAELQDNNGDVLLKVDWTTFNDLRQQGEQAEDPTAAIQHFSAAIRALMAQVRKERTDTYPAAQDCVL